MALGDVGDQLGSGVGVVDAGGGDEDGRHQAEGVGEDVPLAADELRRRDTPRSLPRGPEERVKAGLP